MLSINDPESKDSAGGWIDCQNRKPRTVFLSSPPPAESGPAEKALRKTHFKPSSVHHPRATPSLSPFQPSNLWRVPHLQTNLLVLQLATPKEQQHWRKSIAGVMESSSASPFREYKCLFLAGWQDNVGEVGKLLLSINNDKPPGIDNLDGNYWGQ